MEYRSPNPVSISAVHPAMPTIVISARLLYRKRFRTVTFWVKLSRFHIKGTRSRNTRFPGLGAFGRISWAGNSRMVAMEAPKAVSPMQTTATAVHAAPNPQWMGVKGAGRL